MVPYEAWTGVKPNLKHVKVFGCKAFVHVPRKHSKKLGDRSKEYVFVGYDEEKKGYRLLDLKYPKNIFVERSVAFNENSFPAIELKLEREAKSRIQGESKIITTSDTIMIQQIPKSKMPDYRKIP